MVGGAQRTVGESVLARGGALKGYTSGTHRTVTPAETLARLKPLLPRMGITRLANVTGLDTIGIPVVMSVRPNSRSRSVSQGKGLDLDAASHQSRHSQTGVWPARQVRRLVPVAAVPESCVPTD